MARDALQPVSSWTTFLDHAIVLFDEETSAFIVRVWIEQREIRGAPVEWRGSIEHVASGRIKYVTDLSEIGRFIRPFLEGMGVGFDS